MVWYISPSQNISWDSKLKTATTKSYSMIAFFDLWLIEIFNAARSASFWVKE
jgi:hypothetical protein